jgi:HPt (histidine-containing phosphotransfer) domain-containing protein
LRRAIGPVAARSLLLAFDEQLRETWPKAPVDEEDWRQVLRHAHDLVSAAGLLGYASLSVASRELTTIIQDGGAATRKAFEALDLARMEQAAAVEDLQGKLVDATLPDSAA